MVESNDRKRQSGGSVLLAPFPHASLCICPNVTLNRSALLKEGSEGGKQTSTRWKRDADEPTLQGKPRRNVLESSLSCVYSVAAAHRCSCLAEGECAAEDDSSREDAAAGGGRREEGGGRGALSSSNPLCIQYQLQINSLTGYVKRNSGSAEPLMKHC